MEEIDKYFGSINKMSILDLMDIDEPQFLHDLEIDFINHLTGLPSLLYYPEEEIINFLHRYPLNYSFNDNSKNIIQKYLSDNLFVSRKLIKIIRRTFPRDDTRIGEIFVPLKIKNLNPEGLRQTIKKRLNVLVKQEYKETYDINLITKLMEYLLSFKCLQENEECQCRGFIESLKKRSP